jgi:hypothetical protein
MAAVIAVTWVGDPIDNIPTIQTEVFRACNIDSAKDAIRWRLCYPDDPADQPESTFAVVNAWDGTGELIINVPESDVFVKAELMEVQ